MVGAGGDLVLSACCDRETVVHDGTEDFRRECDLELGWVGKQSDGDPDIHHTIAEMAK